MEEFRDSIVFGPYRLKAKIAEGGMAEVLLATSTQRNLEGQFLAIKRLLPHLNSNKSFVDLLVHEAKIGVLLNHPSIAAVYDLGSYKSDFFIAMEYIHGKSLDRLLEKIRAQQAPKIPIEVATFIVLEIIRALTFAHQLKDAKGRELNIIHRDISPGNILLGYRGEIKLVDFGIATAESRLQQGFAQSAMGKLAYMAPEQAVNDPVVKASDIYSLGVVYYELLTGQLPFQAENPNALIKKVIDGRYTDLKIIGPSIAPGLRDIVNTCLQRSSRKRYQTCPDLFEAIVAHFKSSIEVDFTARATREYYKKKLAEYMRTIFEEDMVRELEIVQKALREETVSEELKVTAPQDLPSMPETEMGVEEATVFEADHTDEATRHYPLTQDEREKLIKGLPAKDVIKPATGFLASITHTEKTSRSKMEAGETFNSPTVPDYDLAMEQSSIRRISVKEKLEKSSLRKEEKENLELQMPAMEITNLVELEAFEQSTFSGQKDRDVPVVEGRSMTREEIMGEFDKIKQNPPPLTYLSSSAYGSEPKVDPRRQSSPVNRTTSGSAHKEKDSDSALTWIIAIVMALVVGGGVYLGTTSFEDIRQKIFGSRLGLVPTQTIALISLGETPADQQKLMRDHLMKSQGSEGLQGVINLFNREYTRYTSDTRSVLRFEWTEPEVLIRGISHQPNALELMGSTEVFPFLSRLEPKTVFPFNASIILYFFPYEPRSSTNLNFPSEFMAPRLPTKGIVFAPAHESMDLQISLSIARELAFLYGVSDARDAATGIPLNPDGLADPTKTPVYPQDYADLMGRDIALSPLQKKPITSLEQIKIGPFTARKLGWIKKSESN